MKLPSPGEKFFFRFLDMVGDRRSAVVIEAYFDESERAAGTICVAGYAFAAPQAKKFTKDWERLFGEFGGFHMNEFVHGRGRFTGVPQRERDRLLREAVCIINKRITAGAAVSCKLDEMKAVSPKWIRGFGSAYPACCHWAMTGLVMVLEKLGVMAPIAYVFEKGHPDEAEARYFVNSAALSDKLRAIYHYHSDAFIPKTDAVPLQAADLLAWEWAKFDDETLDQGLRPLRKSLRALFEYDTKRYQVAHFGGAKLVRAMEKYARITYEQLEKERLAKAAKRGA
jgi:hypothetical protein